MADHIHGAVDTRALAVPHTENAVILCTFEQVHLLAAPDSRRSKVFINARLKLDIVFTEEFRRRPHRLVDAAQR